MAVTKKRYLYKIYDSAGAFITTWADVESEPSFSIELNNGFSELVVTLSRAESEYDEGVSVAYGNQLKLYAFDADSPLTGVLIYSGTLTRYVPTVNSASEVVQVTFLSYFSELDQLILESGTDTTVTYTTDDPTDILKDLLDKFTGAGGRLDYDGGSTDNTGGSVTYTFNTVTYQEAIKKVLELSPADFYLRIGADDIVYFQQRSTVADHYLVIGREIIEYIPEKRIENIVNTVYVIGGGSPKLFKKYTDTGSVSAYGVHSMRYNDSRITTTNAASAIKERIFDTLAEPEIRVTFKVMDNNGDATNYERGYDIESFKVGNMVKILNATSKANNLWDISVFDVSSWDYDITNASSLLLQIMRIEYNPDYVIIELSNKQPNIVARVEEINRQFVDSLNADNPTAPS